MLHFRQDGIDAGGGRVPEQKSLHFRFVVQWFRFRFRLVEFVVVVGHSVRFVDAINRKERDMVAIVDRKLLNSATSGRSRRLPVNVIFAVAVAAASVAVILLLAVFRARGPFRKCQSGTHRNRNTGSSSSSSSSSSIFLDGRI